MKGYLIELEDEIAIIRFTQKPDLQICKAATKELADRDIYQRRIVAHEPFAIDLDLDDMKKLASYCQENFVKPSRFALVAPEDLFFGISRMYEVYRKDKNSITKVFRTEDEAREWIRQ